MLEPDSNIQKYLISSPCYFVGEYKTDQLTLEVAIPSLEDSHKVWDSIHQTPYSRNFLIILFKTDKINDGKEIPNLSHIYAKRLSILISIFYGKRIDEHGFLELDGGFMAPDISNIISNKYHYIAPFNQLPRKDIGDLTKSRSDRPCLDRIYLLAPLINNILKDSDFNSHLFTAGRFYLHSLQSLNDAPEIAYLDLISCGEVLSNYADFSYSEKDLLPEDLLDSFQQLESKCNEIINIPAFKNHFRSIKRRFTKALIELLNDYYFDNDINDLPKSMFGYRYQKRISKKDAELHIRHSYDLRSKYIHAGRSFAQYIVPLRNLISEVKIGDVVVNNKDSDLKKTLNNALTYVGLERLMRFCLLRFIQKFGGINIDERLNDN